MTRVRFRVYIKHKLEGQWEGMKTKHVYSGKINKLTLWFNKQNSYIYWRFRQIFVIIPNKPACIVSTLSYSIYVSNQIKNQICGQHYIYKMWSCLHRSRCFLIKLYPYKIGSNLSSNVCYSGRGDSFVNRCNCLYKLLKCYGTPWLIVLCFVYVHFLKLWKSWPHARQHGSIQQLAHWT